MQADIAIVVVGFNRPLALKRLLQSIGTADYFGYLNIPLFISLDYSGSLECGTIADEFIWNFGTKHVIKNQENKGLKKHILSCGDITIQYEAIILLEDDLFVASSFYDYSQQAYDFYKHDNAIAGIGLYNYRYNEFAHCPFEPLTDGYDSYFMQIPCSWGQLWTKKQWESFKLYVSQETFTNENPMVPSAVLNWPVKSSWKRTFYKYMVDTGRYFIYPRISLTTNFGDIGEHFKERIYVWQTPLLIGSKKFLFARFNQSISIYDSFFELDLSSYEKITGDKTPISFDLNGTKSLSIINTEYLISSKYCKRPIQSFLPTLYPYECNVLFGIKGEPADSLVFCLGKTATFLDVRKYDRLDLDVKRTLPHMDYLVWTAKNQVFETNSYKVGSKLLHILNLPKRLFTKVKLKYFKDLQRDIPISRK